MEDTGTANQTKFAIKIIQKNDQDTLDYYYICLLYTSPSPRDS